MKNVSFSLENGNEYYGKIDGQRFYIGKRVFYDGNKGLANTRGTSLQKYNRNDYRAEFGFWADFINPTCIAEGALFHTLNTYDRAHFTFTFLQYAAHVPNGDFVIYFRTLLSLPSANEYFPDLVILNGRINKITDSGNIQLESDESTEKLIDYLNPSVKEVEDTEVIIAAKFVHWAMNDPLHRRIQVDIGVKHFKENMISYAKRYNLDGIDDVICLAVCDIRHQGRGKSQEIIAALSSPKPLDALLKIGEPKYHNRLVTLKSEINKLIADGSFGKMKYNLAKQEFVIK